MNRKWVFALVAAAAFLGLAPAGWAGYADFGLAAGYQRMWDGAFVGGGYLRWDWREVLMVETRVLYHSEDAGNASVEMIPIQLSGMVFVLRRDWMLSPFLLGGVGMYISRTVPDQGDSESNFDFGWHLGLGCDWNLNDRIFLEGDFRYTWLDVDFSNKTIGEKLSDFDSWMTTAGIGFRL